MATCPALIVEGDGDKLAVPRLIREIYSNHSIYDVMPRPRPKTHVDIKRLRRQGELERFVTYAARDPGADSVIVFLDCEDFEAPVIFSEFHSRLTKIKLPKKIGLVLIKSEFESLFLFCLPKIADDFRDFVWIPDRLSISGDIESIRDAKGRISAAMKERSYKPTRDQERFVGALDHSYLRSVSPSYVRLEQTLLWLRNNPDSPGVFFPNFHS